METSFFISRKELAIKLGITPRTLHRYFVKYKIEVPPGKLSPQTVADILAVLDISLSYSGSSSAQQEPTIKQH
jgi:hypothetical protein